MKIRLLDYANVEHWVDIPDDTKEVEISVVSGDMILKDPIYYDTGMDKRSIDFYDGTCYINRKQFEKLNTISNSYDIWELTSIYSRDYREIRKTELSD